MKKLNPNINYEQSEETTPKPGNFTELTEGLSSEASIFGGEECLTSSAYSDMNSHKLDDTPLNMEIQGLDSHTLSEATVESTVKKQAYRANRQNESRNKGSRIPKLHADRMAKPENKDIPSEYFDDAKQIFTDCIRSKEENPKDIETEI